jgi:hypothetical protein
MGCLFICFWSANFYCHDDHNGRMFTISSHFTSFLARFLLQVLGGAVAGEEG